MMEYQLNYGKEEANKNTMLENIHTFDELFNAIRKKIERLEERNQWLVEENEKLKNEVWRDEKMKEMREKYQEMSDAYHRGFPITKEEWLKIQGFKDEHRLASKGMFKIDNESARFHYEFRPTGLGTVGTIVCSDGSRFDFQGIN